MLNEVLLVSAAVTCGLVAGIFFAFSTFVMRSLGELAPEAGAAAMQSINKVILRSSFMPLFFGAAILCVVIVFAGVQTGALQGLLMITGAACYLVGTILVTMVCNVPRNQHLGRKPPSDAATQQYWQEYLVSWTRWNHVRTAAAMLATVLFMASI